MRRCLSQLKWEHYLFGLERLESVSIHLANRVVLAHTRPEAIRGLLPAGRAARVLGYRNRGGTLDVEGMLFANGCSWLHVLTAVAELTGNNITDWLTSTEQDALAGRIDPRSLLRAEENP